MTITANYIARRFVTYFEVQQIVGVKDIQILDSEILDDGRYAYYRKLITTNTGFTDSDGNYEPAIGARFITFIHDEFSRFLSETLSKYPKIATDHSATVFVFAVSAMVSLYSKEYLFAFNQMRVHEKYNDDFSDFKRQSEQYREILVSLLILSYWVRGGYEFDSDSEKGNSKDV